MSGIESIGNQENNLTKEDIARDWLPRNTGTSLDSFGKYILLVNFKHYVYEFAKIFDIEVMGEEKNMQTATSNDVTIINYGVGSPNAALILDLLSAVKPHCAIFLGKCGGLKKSFIPGTLIVPVGSIRGEGTSNDYFPPDVPALPSFAVQRSISHILKKNNREYSSGIIYSTNRRVWEHDFKFRDMLVEKKASAIDMETATIFIVGLANDIPVGALHLVSDQPIYREGVKSEASDRLVTLNFAKEHLLLGIESIKRIQNSGESLKYFIW